MGLCGCSCFLFFFFLVLSCLSLLVFCWIMFATVINSLKNRELVALFTVPPWGIGRLQYVIVSFAGRLFLKFYLFAK